MQIRAIELIKGAARLLCPNGNDIVLTARQAKYGLEALNNIIDSISNESKSQFSIVMEDFQLSANNGIYTFGPGADFDSKRPIKILAAKVVAGSISDGGGGGGGNPPVASFIADVYTGEGPLVVQFTDTSTGNPTDWLWDFGDGFDSTEQNPEYTYDSVSSDTPYTVTLTVSNADGSDQASDTITITVAGGGGTPQLPVAGFIVNPTPSCLATEFAITDQSNYAETYIYDFGDSVTSTDPSPTHIYSSPGLYTITQTVSNTDGTDQVTHSVSVYVAEGFTGNNAAEGTLDGTGASGSSLWHHYIVGGATGFGSVGPAPDGSYLIFTGPSNNPALGTESVSYLTMPAGDNGTLEFNWEWIGGDTAGDEIFGYVFGGTESSPVLIELGDTAGGNPFFPIGYVQASLIASQLFGFYIRATSTNPTPGTLIISCFNAPQGVIPPGGGGGGGGGEG